MSLPLDILILEDAAADAELVKRELHSGGVEFEARLAIDKAGYVRALEDKVPDLILADYHLPGLEGPETIALANEHCPGVPLIVVSGTLGDERAVEIIKMGATDYVLKDRPKRLAAAVRRAVREVADSRAGQAKSEFISRMGHELRTPLTAIIGFAQLLRTDPLQPEQHEYLDHILTAGHHLLELINEVVDVARIEAGVISTVIEPVRVREVLDEAVGLITPLAAERDVRVEISAVARPGLSAQADRRRLKQVFLNLLSNGVKYSDAGGSLSVSCEEAEGKLLRISFTDSGPGIAPEDMERLFTPFERLGAEHTDVEGMGVGLALSKRLVELMGGAISVRSEVGRGSTFSVDLTSGQEAAPSAESVGVAPGTVTFGPDPEGTVLYIEDTLSNLQLVEGILARRSRVRLITAMRGLIGIDLAREQSPDVILLDVHLPDIRGEEVLSRLRADPQTARIPVVVLSAEATQPKIQRFLAAGARAYLTKPLDIPRFLELLDDALAEVRATR